MFIYYNYICPNPKIKEVSQKKEEDQVPREQNDNQHVVFINESKRENDTFHIFDDEKEDMSGLLFL